MLKRDNVEGIGVFHNHKINIRYQEPTECPICHKAGIVTEIYKIITPYYSDEFPDDLTNIFSILYMCNSCQLVFLCCYQKLPDDPYASPYSEGITHKLLYSGPNNSKEIAFDKYITKLSPDFVDTYNQAAIAMQNNLNEIAGMGYRKALEYLIKDYLVSITPEVKDTIMSSLLSKCINMIDNKKIKTLALKSAWIGNDETHAERRHHDRDVGDLISFLNAIVSWISSELAVIDADTIVN